MYNVYFKILRSDGSFVYRRFASCFLLADLVVYLLFCVHGRFRVVDSSTRKVVASSTIAGRCRMVSSDIKEYINDNMCFICTQTGLTDDYIISFFGLF